MNRKKIQQPSFDDVFDTQPIFGPPQKKKKPVEQ